MNADGGTGGASDALQSTLFTRMVNTTNKRGKRVSTGRGGKVGLAVYSLKTLTAAKRRRVDEEIKETLKNLELSLSRTKKRLTGSRVLKKRSLKSYEATLGALEYFFALISDWESMLILRPDSPDFFPAMNAESLVLFLDWKTKKPGEVLRTRGGEKVKSLLGGYLKADGGWSSPHNTTPWAAAISAVHIAKGMGGTAYEESCRDCIEKYKTTTGDVISGCRFHAKIGKMSSFSGPWCRLHSSVSALREGAPGVRDALAHSEVDALNPDHRNDRICQHIFFSSIGAVEHCQRS